MKRIALVAAPVVAALFALASPAQADTAPTTPTTPGATAGETPRVIVLPTTTTRPGGGNKPTDSSWGG
ncbi:hypothetical protein SNS2_3804 [Streptomyces netropsis]|uniref:Uncharacterized protein n=1 Tax=Streptomyces syringium TaxID=76729 RepID=A0ABS4Y948_9ACTN|nr:hypothetical protein [Streptomyces syringium]MBP2405180.1 hypothetical protein [Streptomyces syringium]SPE58177.1 hypothetical protein SNS2_3804 [Streptomyces netropsis]